MYQSIEALVADAQLKQLPISELMVQQEMATSHRSREEIWEQMRRNYRVMKDAVEKGLTGDGVFSPTGLTGGEAVKLQRYRQKGKTLSGNDLLLAVENAIATNEVNASLGIICATPTAGSSGTLPGVMFGIKDKLELSEDQMVQMLFCASGFGMVVANQAMISGAAGGCQAEVGSASGMAAAAAVEIAGGSPNEASEAFAMAISNLLGLVCDPVAGLVEIPCVKRNAIGAANALLCADMGLAGLTNKIPADDVIDAMRRVGKSLPPSLRETGLGGLAATREGMKLKMQIFGTEIKI
ncbi:L-serine ammonia-lyase, iron-sulfur-dependent, subunit alpha [Jeotgalibaca sp. PTS2502]|jgi:L-serine dehydratase|uniref:L-serine dehydratase n=2 Tax=Jeotgalibaca TaxID=1470540 RepID=A0A6G7K7M4_9LACT|nr:MULTISPECIES: L-serine ammonia-lyase, iron-sulfur-dependent, subunit alpha [Jeotgalibaca]APZ48373.1 L-serine ammonia-lyase, iron-sulfur-dependent, subunit alpha [Jeotgalibaca sp. PTS2502]QII81269.1 L-serine ammonia-lyase, iron-sulfur-dependent, subunit alpha [Jeotgalibaca arthritidis]HJA89293.1 L-serine ammonia-lyase, iron-sulfur-dependent, subunit alpha [Candidatus Jeotgalibaca merdavium]